MNVQTAIPPLWRASRRVFALGVLSAVGYLYLFRLSFEALRPGAHESIYISHFLATYAVLFVMYLLLITPMIRKAGMDRRCLWFAIGFALLFRAILLSSEPILEDDIYRYMWDGHVQLQGVNPYRYAPIAPELQPYRTDYWLNINYPHVPTIYPPALQFVFVLSEWIYPGNVVGMKLILLCFDIGAIFLLLWALPLLGRPPEWCLIYAWSPLALKEIANSGHADAVSAFLIALIIGLIASGRHTASSIALAALTLTKFFGALLLPLFHRVWSWRLFGLYFGVVALMYSPHLSFGVNVFEGLMTFSREWLFNAGAFMAAVWVFRESLGYDRADADFAARAVMAIVILAIAAWQSAALSWRKAPDDLLRAMLIVIGAVLMCSPVVDPWYVVWIIPLLCVFPNRAWLLFTGLVALSYWYYYAYHFPLWVRWAQYGPFFALLVWDGLRNRTTAVKPEQTIPQNN